MTYKQGLRRKVVRALPFLGGAGLVGVAVGLSTSPSLTSIAVALLGAYLVGTAFAAEPFSGRGAWLLSAPFVGLYLLQTLSWLYTEDTAQWFVEMRVKLPFLFLLPAAAQAWTRAPESVRRTTHLVFHLALLIVGLATLARLLLNPQWALTEIYHSRYVPMLGGISHIYYAGLVVSGLVLLWVLPLWGGTWVKASIAGLYLCILHGLALRTGLAALYGAGAVMLLRWAVQKPRRWPWAAATLGLGSIVLNLLVCHLPPLRQRWENLRRDLATYRPGAYITHSSVARRLAAIEATWMAFQKAPLLGVGMADNYTAVAAEIPKLPYRWDPATYILPHNQFLEYALGLGVVGLGLFGVFWGIALTRKGGPAWITWLVIWLLLMQGEAFLERQVGVTAFLWGTGLLYAHLKLQAS